MISTPSSNDLRIGKCCPMLGSVKCAKCVKKICTLLLKLACKFVSNSQSSWDEYSACVLFRRGEEIEAKARGLIVSCCCG